MSLKMKPGASNAWHDLDGLHNRKENHGHQRDRQQTQPQRNQFSGYPAPGSRCAGQFDVTLMSHSVWITLCPKTCSL